MFKIEFIGLQRILDKLKPGYLLDLPLRRFMNKSGRILTVMARIKAEPYSRQVASSINYQVEHSPMPLSVTVRPEAGLMANVLEYGTGLLSEAPDSKGGAHFPPWGEANPGLEDWAQRHGLPNGFVVARAIAQRGGLRPHHFLRAAMEESLPYIRDYIEQLGQMIGRMWERQ